jgi:hypothetical protein
MLEYLIRISADGKQLESESNKAASSLGKIDSVVTDLAARLGGLFSAKWMLGQAKEAMAWGSSMEDLALRTGVSVEALQEFKAAAEGSGATIDQVAMALRYLSRAMAEAAQNPKGEHADAFARMGMSLEKIRASNPETIFRAMASAVARMPASAQLTADALTLMGRTGDELFPAFKNGFSEAIEQARRLGVVVGSDVTKKLDDADDAMTRFKQQWQAFRAEEVARMLPSQGVVGFAEDALAKFRAIKSGLPRMGPESQEGFAATMAIGIAAKTAMENQVVQGLLQALVNEVRNTTRAVEKTL